MLTENTEYLHENSRNDTLMITDNFNHEGKTG
jgi:hypothetical protein